ncbi:unnamed protein product [Rhizophagus irregularis]|nr:unnamed protein product [Rhizophagus irregularis]
MTQMPKTNDRIDFENAIKALEAQVANVGTHLTIDSVARQAYRREIQQMADALRKDVSNGKMTWAQAAQQAQETRNLVMEASRLRSTPVGRSFAQKMKPAGFSLNELVAKYATQMYGKSVVFSKLTPTQKNRIFAALVAAAGKSNVKVSVALARVSFAGRSLLILSLGLSAYTIATSTDKVAAAKKESLATGAGIAGGIAGGALAGLACGPGAPVCVTVGAFVGGALAAYGAGFL